MALAKPPAKGDVVLDILELLDVETNEKEKMAENLNKMSKEGVNLLFHYMAETMKKPSVAETENAMPLNKDMMPQDVAAPKNPVVMNEYLRMLPEVGRTIGKAFMDGDLPNLKRAIGINGRIVYNCEKMVAQQLWDAIKVRRFTENEGEE